MARNEKADMLEDPLIRFAARVLKLTTQLPKTRQGRHIAAQLLRSGTAAAPNYGEARAAESRADFIHKLKIALKELNENCELAAASAGAPRSR
jgi:four helix bundle protein